jgi:protein-S-isoprenylcysteine O-methyltransferase Ste14
MPPNPRGPAVRVPPPFIFVGGWLLAWWLDTRLSFEIDGAGAGPVQVGLGLLLGAGGLGLVFWGIVTFLYARTPVIPHHPARALVRHGPYRFSRNPMYVGLTLLYLGLSFVVNAAWPIVVLPVVLIVLATYVVRREETHLREAFGPDYDTYCAGVRRWL